MALVEPSQDTHRATDAAAQTSDAPRSTVGRALRAADRRMRPALRQARRLAFLAQLRATAELAESTIDVDIHPTVRLGRPIRFRIAPRTHNVLRIGADSWIDDRVEFRMSGGIIEIGEWVEIRTGCRLMVSGHLTITGPSGFGWDVGLHCDERLLLKKWASISEGATVVDSYHFHTDPGTWFWNNTGTKPTTLGENCWIASNAIVTAGCTIGDQATVAAGAVVMGDVPDDHIAVGAPAVAKPRKR